MLIWKRGGEDRIGTAFIPSSSHTDTLREMTTEKLNGISCRKKKVTENTRECIGKGTTQKGIFFSRYTHKNFIFVLKIRCLLSFEKWAR